ncbi:MAG: cyclase family protein [Bacillota bacterium]
MKIFDISMSIDYNMPVYKNKDDKRPVRRTTRDFPNDNIYESRIDMDMHTGTHIDAPLHMVKNGDTIENIRLDRVITECRVIDLTSVEDKIKMKDLTDKEIVKGDFIILKTKNSYVDSFYDEFVYLDRSGAKFLKEKGVIGVGIDSLGIERDQADFSTHKTLLESGIIILEGLRLSEVGEGVYILCALPLKIIGSEASPVRAVLIDNKGSADYSFA